MPVCFWKSIYSGSCCGIHYSRSGKFYFEEGNCCRNAWFCFEKSSEIESFLNGSFTPVFENIPKYLISVFSLNEILYWNSLFLAQTMNSRIQRILVLSGFCASVNSILQTSYGWGIISGGLVLDSLISFPRKTGSPAQAVLFPAPGLMRASLGMPPPP